MTSPHATAGTRAAGWRRRTFLGRVGLAAAGAAVSSVVPSGGSAQVRGERPSPVEGVSVMNPRGRVPVGIIIDDSTCLVNLNRFAMPQFDEAYGGQNPVYRRPWKDWPAEIPDAFVRKFGEWAVAEGVKGKFSVVPYPACVGRLDRMLPGWSRRELDDSLGLVRELIMPQWDIHPEMVTHTRVVDLKTGQPYPEASLKFMENWDWTTGRSADEIGAYMAYALRILKEVGLSCEGITTPGGFGNRARPQLAQAAFQSVRDVFGAEIPHYFRDLEDRGDASVAPRVELASGLEGPDPRCVVSVVGCTGDWTGGWDNTEPAGVDRFITEDLEHGRLVDVIGRGEPAMMVCHWTGIYWNGQERGFQVFREVVKRLRAGFGGQTIWMKLGEVARYWAARELTQLVRIGEGLRLSAPFSCRHFTVSVRAGGEVRPRWRHAGGTVPLREVGRLEDLQEGTWWAKEAGFVACFELPRGVGQLEWAV